MRVYMGPNRWLAVALQGSKPYMLGCDARFMIEMLSGFAEGLETYKDDVDMGGSMGFIDSCEVEEAMNNLNDLISEYQQYQGAEPYDPNAVEEEWESEEEIFC